MKPYIFLLSMLYTVCLSAQSYDLAGAVAYGLEHSNDVKIKQLDIASADSDIKEYRAIGIPQVNGGIDYSYYFQLPVQPVEDFISPAVYGVLFQENVIQPRELADPEVFEFTFFQPHNLTGKIEASSLIFDGSYLYGLKAARLYKELVNRELEMTEQDIKSNVTKAYAAVLVARKNKEVLDQNIQVLTKTLEDTKAFFENGFVESLDVDRLQLSLDGLKTQSTNLEQLISVSKNLLKFQMGYPIDQEIILTENLEALEAQYIASNEQKLDITKRVEYQLLETNKQLNELDLQRHKAGYLPSARAFASYQGSIQRTNLFDNTEAGLLPTLVAGISINIPIYDGGQKSARMQKSKLTLEKIDLQKREFERGMTLQVENTRLAYKNAQQTVLNQKNTLALSQKIFDKTQIKFREGVGSSVELSQAEADLYQAQGAYISSLYDLLLSKIDMDIALGIL